MRRKNQVRGECRHSNSETLEISIMIGRVIGDGTFKKKQNEQKIVLVFGQEISGKNTLNKTRRIGQRELGDDGDGGRRSETKQTLGWLKEWDEGGRGAGREEETSQSVAGQLGDSTSCFSPRPAF